MGTIQYVVFCDWLLSLSIVFLRFIHVVACVSTSFLFIAEQYSIVYRNRLTDIEDRLVVAKGEMGWGRDGVGVWD